MNLLLRKKSNLRIVVVKKSEALVLSKMENSNIATQLLYQSKLTVLSAVVKWLRLLLSTERSDVRGPP